MNSNDKSIGHQEKRLRTADLAEISRKRQEDGQESCGWVQLIPALRLISDWFQPLGMADTVSARGTAERWNFSRSSAAADFSRFSCISA